MSRTLTARAPAALSLCMLATLAGCSAAGKHRERHIPQYGVVDPDQPGELRMVSMPTYVVEPPDELEVTVRPASLDLPITTVVVRQDGVIDLGFHGDVYVAGLTLEEVEQKVAQHVASRARTATRERVEASIRLVSGNVSKQYYVLGTVTTQGRFPLNGSETVLDGILQAGLRSNSLPEKAYLVRPHPHGGPDTVLKIDWSGIKDRGDTTTNYQLFPGDRIVVPGGKAPSLLSTLLGGG